MKSTTVTVRFKGNETVNEVYEMQIRSLVGAVHLAANDYVKLEQIRKEVLCLVSVIEHLQGNLYMNRSH